MSTSRPILPLIMAALLASAATSARALPALPENLDPARVVSSEIVLSTTARLDLERDGQSGTRLDWAPGAVHRVDLRDGSTRFVVEGGALENEAAGSLLLPRESRWLEVPPAGEVRLVVETLRLRPLPGLLLGLGREEGALNSAPDGDRLLLDPSHSDAALLARAGGFDEPVLLGEPVIFRDLRMVSLTLHPIVLRDGSVQAVESVSLRLEYGPVSAVEDRTLAPNAARIVSGNELPAAGRSWSGNMERIYQSLVPNHGQFYNRVDESAFPVYLITGSPNYLSASNPGMSEFIKWKREKGFDVRVVPFDQIPGGGVSISFGALRDWMRGQWQTLRPEYLLLVGDVDGATACPDSVVQAHTGDYDVSDHFYALQEGNDYFPELFVGRFSVDNAQQLYVMGQKQVIHEKSPNLAGNPDFLRKALVVSCNYSDTGTPPISPNQTSRWVIDKLRANGFIITGQDSIFYPPTTDGGSLINAAINQGRGIISYRGWANSNGWIYPAYDRDDIEALTNVMLMPIVGSFVCQTGAFGQGSGDVTVEDPCFGEKFTRLGSPGLPRGAVAFVGPSDLHTRTQYNNPVCSGFFNAIFDLGLTSIGPALLNGKMELYRGYPLERNDRFSSYFYFHIYNVLGDANIKVWRGVPTALVLDAPTSLTPGQSVLEVSVSDPASGPMDGVLVTLTSGEDGSLLLARGVTVNGHLLLSLDPTLLPAGTSAVLTTEHVDHLPAQAMVTMADEVEALELAGLTVTEETPDGQYRADEVLEVRLNLRASGSGSVPAGAAVLRDPAQWEILPDWFVIESGTVATPALAAGASAATSEAFRIRLAADAPDEGQLHLAADVLAGSFLGLVDGRLTISNHALELVSATWRSGADQLLTGQVDTLDLVLANSGAFDFSAPMLTLSSSDPRVDVLAATASVGALPMGASATASFILEGGAGLFTGQTVHVDLVTEENGRSASLTLPLPVGGILPEDPLGPDAYGYFAVESEDYDVRSRPVYDWVELDPAYGGSGATRLLLLDDAVTTVDLPFPVTHYGRTGSRLSICSNGWVSLGDTWIDDFRNWNLPSSLGPPNLIAGYWDDLKPHYPDSLYVPVFWRHDAAEGRVVVSWSRAYNRYAWENPGQPLQEFEIILYDQAMRPTPTGDTEILVQWKRVTDLDQNNNFATCGMENFGHDVGIQVSFASQPSPGCLGFGAERAVLFTTLEPRHDSSFRVRVLEPLPQQWLNSATPVIRWDHERFAQTLQREDLVYTVSVSTASVPLFTREVVAAGELDLAPLGLTLPEGTPLFLDLSARADTSSYPAQQGRISFSVDTTPPGLTPALMQSGLYPGHLELGLLSSEALSVLRADVLDAQGALLTTLAQDPGLTLLGTGQELRYLRAQLAGGFASLRISAVDAHGMGADDELPLVALPFSSGLLELPAVNGAQMSWNTGASGWAMLLGRRMQDDERLLPLGQGLHALDLRLPEGVHAASLSMESPEDGVLVQRQGTVWRVLEQRRVGGRSLARLERSGVVGIMPAESVDAVEPATFSLDGNFPNPFNPETWIRFQLPVEGEMRMVIYNLAGAQVRRLAAGRLASGSHQLRWDGRTDGGLPAASGLYLTRLEWQGQVRTHRMLLVR